MAQLSPIHSWKLILPSVVSAVKSGACSPSRIAMVALLAVGVVWKRALPACRPGRALLVRCGPASLTEDQHRYRAVRQDLMGLAADQQCLQAALAMGRH